MLDPAAQERLCNNIAGSLSQVPQRIQDLQVSHFTKCDPAYGEGVKAAIERALGGSLKHEHAGELAHA